MDHRSWQPVSRHCADFFTTQRTDFTHSEHVRHYLLISFCIIFITLVRLLLPSCIRLRWFLTALNAHKTAMYLNIEQRRNTIHYTDTKKVPCTYFNQSINQSINQFICPEYNKHWIGHQRRMQPQLTGALKNNVSKSNKRQYLKENKNLVGRKMFKSNIYHKSRQSPLTYFDMPKV